MQYADDTLMLLPLDLASINRVKILFYLFELLSGLSINFNNSLIYPLVLPRLDLLLVSDVLHCRVSLSLISDFLSNRPPYLRPIGSLSFDRTDKRLAA